MNVLVVVKVYGLVFGNLDDPVQILGKMYDTNLNDKDLAYKNRHQQLSGLEANVWRSRLPSKLKFWFQAQLMSPLTEHYISLSEV